MIRFNPPVVLDACVLANYSLCDTLLRFAEPPALFEPKWSEEIVRETTRTFEFKLDWPTSLVVHFEAQLRTHFADAWITGYEPLMSEMTKEEKDRHVSAAAIHFGATLIVTFNLRDFRAEDLQPWGLRAIHPQQFLIQLFESDSDLALLKLRQQAEDRKRSLEQLLGILGSTVPDFAAVVSAAIVRK